MHILSYIVLMYRTKKETFHFFTFIFSLCNDFTNAKEVLEMFISAERIIENNSNDKVDF